METTEGASTPGLDPWFGPAPLVKASLGIGLLAWLAAALAACSPSSQSDAGQPRVCVGGVIRADGGCEAKCVASKCLANNTCVDNACALKCSSHLECDVFAQRCVAATEDDTDAGVEVCAAAPVRQIGAPCPAGECPAPMTCHISGPGDATAYCTRDCLTNADCPGGYECGTQRDPHAICGTTKGNSNFCGTTTDDCWDAGYGPGTSYLEGSYCLEHLVCLKRDDCAPCQTDLDCSLTRDRCVDVNGAKRCAPACTVGTDCELDKTCVQGACKPLYGACTGSGFCAPCRADSDCEPNFECSHLHGNERSCVDVQFSVTCNASADCPVAPSGRHGMCLDESAQTYPGDSLYHRCYVPFDEASNTYTCYSLTKDAGWPDAGH